MYLSCSYRKSVPVDELILMAVLIFLTSTAKLFIQGYDNTGERNGTFYILFIKSALYAAVMNISLVPQRIRSVVGEDVKQRLKKSPPCACCMAR